MTMNVSMRDLRGFLALADQKSFTRAAELCFLSQSAFSAMIQGLEGELGVKLFTRSTRRVELTPEGEVFAGLAKRLLAEFARAESEMRDHAEKRKGRVAVAALPSLAAGWLAAVLKDFRASYPGVTTEMWDTLSDECLSLVRSGRADFALCAAGAEMAGLEAEPLCTDAFCVVMPRDHVLASRRTLVAADLVDHPFIHLAQTSSVRQLLDAALDPLRIHGILDVAQLATVASLVARGFGISVVPHLALYQFDSPDITVRPLVEPHITRTIYVVRQRDKPLSIAAETFLAMLTERRACIPAALPAA